MNSNEKTYEMLIGHYRAYPKLEVQDMLKFIHQSSFGCEHLLSSQKNATEYIREEYKNVSPASEATIDELDGEYSRVHLSYINKGLSADTLGRLFFLSAKKEENAKADLIQKVEALKYLTREKLITLSESELTNALAKWEAAGFSALHHSDAFRREYNPSYRVISNGFIPFLPIFAEIDKRIKKGPVTACIEGKCASGKTTLGNMLSEIYDCNVFHMDDFFLRSEQRTVDRYAETGGNIDYERFLEEVLIPLRTGQAFVYKKFDCSTMSVGQGVAITPKKINIIEGTYSMHPKFSGYYDFSVCLNIGDKLQKERIIKRNSPQMAERFFSEWIPLENRYFEETDVKQRCSITINIK